MRWLETRVPPPLVMLLCGAIGYLASRLAAGPVVPLPMPALLAGGLVAIGVTLNLLPKLAFRRARTTVNPLRPAVASALVTQGVYRYTRNPMYLGQATVLAASCCTCGARSRCWLSRCSCCTSRGCRSCRKSGRCRSAFPRHTPPSASEYDAGCSTDQATTA